MKIKVVKNILAANDQLALDNRKRFDADHTFVINVMSSPGAGKTSLLAKTISPLKEKVKIGVIEGDIQGDNDARLLGELGIPVVQFNTGGACHLDANMIAKCRADLPAELDLLFIENVGNLVCPAEFNLGEHCKVMLTSTPEGLDKIDKYPLMFMESQVVIVNKIDLVPYVDFDVPDFLEKLKKINPTANAFPLSCKTGEGLSPWCDWLKSTVDFL